ncbi:hypothetical protein C8J56DRAFT_1061690 [Mycena floridula]|nr:hypothetical protein C8J56DRAFT_1061690 [Mycena floridula]
MSSYVAPAILGSKLTYLSSPQAQYLEMMQSKGRLDFKDLDAVYDRLEAVSPSFLIGEWTGRAKKFVCTERLKQVRWAGKDFHSEEDVDPIMVYDEKGSRVWSADHGKARIREIKFRGVVSAAMVYDVLPIIDYFRYVDENTVCGVMDAKGVPEELGSYHFYLVRLQPKAVASL